MAKPSPFQLPNAVIAVVSEALADHYSHTQLNTLFEANGAPGEAPAGNKVDKCKAWFRAINMAAKSAAYPDPFADAPPVAVDVLRVLGAVLEEYIDVPIPEGSYGTERWAPDRERVKQMLAQHGLRYATGGKILGGGTLSAPTKSLDERLQKGDLTTVEAEFNRALKNVDADPPAALTAACAVLEAVCKAFISKEAPEEMPAKSDLQPVWRVVQRRLNLDPTLVESQDLKTILGGLSAIVHGVGALRTHDGSAHGQKPRKKYKIEPRHARLAVHAAHTLALFVIEAWERPK